VRVLVRAQAQAQAQVRGLGQRQVPVLAQIHRQPPLAGYCGFPYRSLCRNPPGNKSQQRSPTTQ